MKKIKLIFVSLIFTGILAIPAAAQDKNFGINDFLNSSKQLSPLNDAEDFYLDLAVKIINTLLELTAALAIIFGIYGAITILASFGDEQKIATAKQNLIYIAIGLAVIALVFTLINFVPRVLEQGSL